MAFLV
ncbi:hypothetical protein D048_4645A, partial [Vibrio parahaemolyticus VPTS-2009]